ncbi:MAG TPA: serine hydrolase domain-containing protein [Thermoanaerobaculia bacterium]
MFDDYAGDNPGIATAVLRGGEVVLRECHGLADLESRTPVTPSTNFRLASVTKPFIAEAIGILVNRGLLRYDDEVFGSATVRQLLTHTSAIVDYEDRIPPERTEQVSDADVLRMLATTDRTGFHYSNSGYVLLGLLIERVSGQSLESFLRDEIFAKHGMHGTTVGPPAANRAYGYDRDDARWVRRDQSVTSATRGDGGMYSSIDDLSGWVAALEDGVSHVDTDIPGVRYGLGWFYAENTIYHYGDTVSFRNAIVRWPAERLAVIVLTNRNEGDPVDLAKRVTEYYLNI